MAEQAFVPNSVTSLVSNYCLSGNVCFFAYCDDVTYEWYGKSRGDWGPLGHVSYFVKYLDFEKQYACVTYHNLLTIHSAT